MKQIMDAAPMAIGVVRGPDQHFEYANSAFCRLHNTGGAPVSGRPAAEVLSGEEGAGTLAIIHEVFSTGRDQISRENERATSSGEPSYWNLHALPLDDGEGRAEGLVLMGYEITEDVLARRRAEDLAAQAGRDIAALEAVLSTIPGGVAIYGPQGELIRSNEFGKELLGLTPDYEQGALDERMRARQVVSAGGRLVSREETPLFRALQGEATRGQIMGVRPAAGEEITWISVSAAPLRDASRPGDPVAGAVLSFTDVTTLQQAQEQLEQVNTELVIGSEELQTQSEELQQQNAELAHMSAELESERSRLRAVLDSTPEAIVVADAEARILFSNPAAGRLFARPVPTGRRYHSHAALQLCYADGRRYEPRDLPLTRSALDGEAVAGVEMAVTWPDGQRRDLLVSSAPTRDGAGRLNGAVGVFQDVTERKQMEGALRRAEERYRAFIEHSSEAIWRIELELPIPVDLPEEKQIQQLYQYGQIAECNTAMARLHGFDDPGQVAGFRLGQILPLVSPRNHQQMRAFVRSGYHLDTVETIDLVKDGAAHHFLNSLIGIVDPESKALVRVWGIQRDITERVELENELRRARDSLEQRVRERTAELQRTRALLEQRVEERTQELSTVLSIAHHLSSELRLEPLLEVLLEELKKLLEYTGAAIFLVEGQELSVLDYRGPLPREAMLELRIPIEQAYGLADVVRRISSQVIPDVEGNSDLARGYRLLAHPAQKQMMTGARSLMVVPLVVRDRAIGVLHLDHREPGAFGVREVQWGVALAKHLAVAIDNARLYQQAGELAVLEERQRLARDLHDAVSQILFSASLIADVLPRIQEQDPSKVPALLTELGELNRGARAEMRMLLMELRPQSLLDVGLDMLLRHLAEATIARAHVEIRMRADDNFPPLPAPVQVALYRIAQETFNNIIKHAEARTVTAELRWSRGGTGLRGAGFTVHLSIADDGTGFDPGSVSAERLGLRIMRERATEIGAALEVDSRPAGGTRVDVTWPHAEQ